MITFKDVTKAYPDGTIAVNQLNMTIEAGECFVLIGPSGCGKTTTMKMVNRLIEPSEGSVSIQQKNIAEVNIDQLRWNIGYVLQQIALFPTMTVAENIAVVPELKKWSKRAIDERIDQLLTLIGLAPAQFRHRYPRELSGGQQQRVGVARALAADPDILLMDEPFSALDPISREQLQEDIKRLQQTIRKTILFVTHDMEEALKLGDRLCIMKDGKVVQIGTPAQLQQEPANEFVSAFIGNRQAPVTLRQLMSPVAGKMPEGISTISADAPLREVYERLAGEPELYVIEGTDVVGRITYQDFAYHLAQGGA
ncbi:ABC transporter ATP-binding protein [Alkalihalobacillus oceani]|uniref:ABC transporter ATP-binding protein n=1 Tax=Halalkalibacter oceani TaxID=1653776 RepID=UPI00203EBB8B|nr:ABC transporter ATP-binding protein [Halalkalibacter oceani]MCM3762109.1 ABC transporter ATP-binding protein [Halalkalibacter oceani]